MKRCLSVLLCLLLMVSLCSVAILPAAAEEYVASTSDGCAYITQDGLLYLPANGAGITYMTKESFSGNYTVEIRTKVTYEGVGLLFGPDNAQALWIVATNPASPSGVWEHAPGNWTSIDKQASSVVSLNTWVTMRLEMQDGTVTTYLNDTLLNTKSLGTTYTSGKLGLRMGSKESGYVDYIRVTKGSETVFADEFSDLEYDKWSYPAATTLPTSNVNYVDGSTLDAQTLSITYPTDGSTGPYPVVMFYHGGAWIIGDKSNTSESDHMLQAMVDNGYAVVRVNYRLAQNAAWPAQIYDCKAAARFIRAHAAEYNLNPDILIAAGASAGGHLAQMMGTTNGQAEFEDLSMGNSDVSSDVQAVISYYGISDVSTWEGSVQCSNLIGQNKDPIYMLLGDDATEADMQAASAYYHVDENTVPMLLTHGMNDTLVSSTQSLRMAAKLAATIGAENVDTYFPSTGAHGVASDWASDAAKEASLNFLAKHFTPNYSLTAYENSRPGSWWEELSSYSNAYLNLKYADLAAEEKLHLILPGRPSGGEYPVIVFVHGGGFSSGNSSGTSALYTCRGALQALQSGYAVAVVDYRLGSANPYPQCIYDVKAAIRYLRANAATYGLDTERFAIWGESAGGCIADLVAVTNDNPAYEDLSMGNADQSSAVQACVSYYAITDMTTARNAQYAPAYLGSAASDSEKLKEASPYWQVGENAPPFYLEHGLADNEVEYTDSIRLYEALLQATSDTRTVLKTFPGITHAVNIFYDSVNVANIVLWLNGVLETDAMSGGEKRNFTQNMTNIWEGDTVYNESVWPIADENGDVADISLLYRADKISSVKSADLSKVYTEGEDYTLVDGKLHIIPTGSIPVTTYDFYYPASGSSFSTNDGRGLYSSEGPAIQQRQIVVTYTHTDAYMGYVPTNKSALLPNTMEKLEQGGNLRIVYYGDSITEGYNSSSFMETEPYLQRWSELMTLSLGQAYPDATISAINTGLSGKTSAWGLQNIRERVTNYDPDLVVIAFGMNDGTQRLNASGFVSNLREIMNGVRAKNPDAEFLLVSTTFANPISTFVGTQCDYESILLSLEGEGVAVAQMNSMHASLLEQKVYADMTGNNINHPNDFLVRVYGQVLAAIFTGSVVYDPDADNPDGNLALHKTVQVTSQVAVSAFAAVNLTNGTTAKSEQPGSLDYGYSSSSYNSQDLSASPTVLTVDLEKVSRVNQVVLWPRTDALTADNTACHFPVSFTVSLSTDGQDFTTVADINDPAVKDLSPRVVDFEATEARYVRITVTAVSAPSAVETISYVQMNEIQVFGEPVPPEEEILLGDLNSDGSLSVTDVVLLRKAILAGSADADTLARGDLNSDGSLSVTDVVLLRKAILSQS